MKKLLALLLILIVVTGCSTDRNISRKDSEVSNDLVVNDRSDNDNATSQLTPEEYFLIGELLEINNEKILIDSIEAGLVWVTLDELIDSNIVPRSIIKVQFGGMIAESYPGQTSGHFIEVLELFVEDAVYTVEQLNDYIADEDVNHVIEWNSLKDYVAYAQYDMEKEGTHYNIYIANLYEEGEKLVHYTEGEMPDLYWFYDTLQIQSSSDIVEIMPPYEEIEKVE